MLKEGVVPGTHGWYNKIGTAYLRGQHPARRVMLGHDRADVIVNLIYHLADTSSEYPCDIDLASDLVDENWPRLGESETQEEEEEEQMSLADEASVMDHMSNKEDFFKGKKQYRKKKLFGVLAFILPRTFHIVWCK
jgi:hypothetical protein